MGVDGYAGYSYPVKGAYGFFNYRALLLLILLIIIFFWFIWN
ncbi:hypothetical protein [Numidum massiliense]|nr:hypothetical protein [Numidum massiliense]